MELVCPAGSLPALRAAADAGADAIYIGFKDDTNARQFSGLNFTERKIQHALEYIRGRGIKLFVAINTYPQPQGFLRWQKAVDSAANIGADAVILADMGVLDYAAKKHPELPLHLSVQASATSIETLKFYQCNFNVRRAILPRVLSLKQVQQLAQSSPIELEVFGFGSLCIMAEGRCHLSSYVTAESPNMCGVCSPASHVSWQESNGVLSSRLNDVLIDRHQAGEKAGYPTLCKGRFQVEGRTLHALEEPTSLNTLPLLPDLYQAGIKAIKLEGRQRSPAYIESVVSTWRAAIDDFLSQPSQYQIKPQWNQTLASNAEGSQTTLGAYSRPWQ